MKKNSLLFLLFAFFLSATSLFSEKNAILTFLTETGPVSFEVELALTAGQQVKGLMERTRLPERAGMLFLFETLRKPVFWMKNTLLSLDILFLDAKGCIQQIQRGMPRSLTRIIPDNPAKAVLEINAGEALLYHLKEKVCTVSSLPLF